MNRKYIVILLLLFCMPSYAQEPPKNISGINSLLGEETALGNKHKSLKDTVNDLNKSFNDAKRRFEKLKKDHKAKKDQLEQKKIEQFVKEEKELKNDVDRLRAETDNLNRNLTQVNAQIAEVENKIKALEPIKDKKYRDIIAKHGPKLEKPFSSMSDADFVEIEKACLPYRVDTRVVEFENRAKKIKEYKVLYVRAKQVCDSKYDKAAIANSLSAIATIVNVNDKQQAELNSIKDQLERFDDGILVFKEFINWLDGRRKAAGGSYYGSDFGDELKAEIFVVGGLGERIKENIYKVPYLKREFDRYVAAMKQNPMAHPPIEEDIKAMYEATKAIKDVKL